MDSYLVTCPTCSVSNRIPDSKVGEQGTCGSCREPLPALYLDPVVLTDDTFSDFVGSYTAPILAEFWAPW